MAGTTILPPNVPVHARQTGGDISIRQPINSSTSSIYSMATTGHLINRVAESAHQSHLTAIAAHCTPPPTTGLPPWLPLAGTDCGVAPRRVTAITSRTAVLSLYSVLPNCIQYGFIVVAVGYMYCSK